VRQAVDRHDRVGAQLVQRRSLTINIHEGLPWWIGNPPPLVIVDPGGKQIAAGLSVSINPRPRCFASRTPTVLLPTPGMPISTMAPADASDRPFSAAVTWLFP